MSHDSSFRADIADFHRQAETLFTALSAGDSDAQWRVKWEHPRAGERQFARRGCPGGPAADDARIVRLGAGQDVHGDILGRSAFGLAGRARFARAEGKART